MFVDEHDPYVNPIGVKGIGAVATPGVAAVRVQIRVVERVASGVDGASAAYLDYLQCQDYCR